MPGIDGRLVGTLLVAMLGLQAVCWLLAKGLRLRLERSVVLCGWLAPLVVLGPALVSRQLLVPTDVLWGTPGAPPIPRAPAYDSLSDTVYQLLPWELEVRHAFAARRLPFWSDTLEGGSSPWANPQAGVLSPLQMAARAFPIQDMPLGELALKILVAFEGTWLLARSTGRSRLASLLAAAGFALGGGFFSWALFPITATVAWVPWLAVGVIWLFRHPGARVIATTAAITAGLLLSGNPETAAFGGLFAAVCGLGLRRKRAGLLRGFGAAALAAALGFGLAAPLLLPFAALLPDSQRAGDTLAQTIHSGPVRALSPPSWFEPGYAAYMLAPTSPHAFGLPYQGPFNGPFNWADSEASYTGLVAFAMALIALLGLRDRRAWPFLGCAAAGPLLTARFLPLAHLLYAIPPLRIPVYSRFLPSAALALCLAGAFGIDLLLSRKRPRMGAWVGLALAAALSLGVAADGWTLALWGLLAVAALTMRWRPRWGAAALAGVLLLDLVPWSRAFLPSGHPGLFYPETEFMSRFAREAGDPAVWRATGGDYLVYPNVLPVYGIADIRPHNPLAPARYLRVLDAAFGFYPTMNEYFAPLRNLDHPLLDFLGVRVVAGSPAVPPSRTLQEIDPGRFAPFTMLRNPDALPRWFFPRAVEVIRPAEIRRWIAALQDARQVSLFTNEAGSWRPAGGDGPPPRPLLTRPGHVVLGIPDGHERLLATSIPWSRGWTAKAGGRRLPILKVDGAFVGVRVPQGASRVELRFLPPGLLAGTVLFAVSLVVLLTLIGNIARGRGGSAPESGGRDRRRSLPAA
ncbi:MAG TPA: YfhO family protein [Thermoanaerobaculia bacterium]